MTQRDAVQSSAPQLQEASQKEHNHSSVGTASELTCLPQQGTLAPAQVCVRLAPAQQMLSGVACFAGALCMETKG